MASIEEARSILEVLGMPPAQCNRMAGMTMLALCRLTPDTSWSGARRHRCTVTEGIMECVKEHYGATYAPNTRETFRRQILHQFVQGGIAEYNPFQPDLPTNSPNAHYAITQAALNVVCKFGEDGWAGAVDEFNNEQRVLKELYAGVRNLKQVPVTLPSGHVLELSPGTHNEVQKAVVELFAPRFVPGGHLLYLGDTARKDLVVDNEALFQLKIHLDDKNKQPDVMLYCYKRGLLVLVEAVTTHGPVSPKRVVELNNLLTECSAKTAYFSAFFGHG